MAGVSGRITVVGVGPAGPELVTPAARDAIDAGTRRFVRTTHHPAMAVVDGAISFDDIAGAEATDPDTDAVIRDRLLSEAEADDIVYIVPGSPLVLERSVDLLRHESALGRIEVRVVPSMSFLDLAWARLGIDPVEAGVRLMDGRCFGAEALGDLGPMLVAQCHGPNVLSDIKRSVDGARSSVVVLKRLGLPDEQIVEVEGTDLGSGIDVDQLTSIYIPELTPVVEAEFGRFHELVRVLREECPWDREQTHGSLRRHLLEETHEALEALDARAVLDDSQVDDELDAHLAEELGDLLYQIFIHARLGAERGAFSAVDVVRGIHDKLVLRHPHVFGDVEARDREAVLSNWEAIKREEKGRTSAMDGIPSGLPALLLALKVQKRAAGIGIDPDGGPGIVPADLVDELDKILTDPSEQAVGDLLFATVQICCRLDHDPEAALRGAADRFQHRFRQAE